MLRTTVRCGAGVAAMMSLAVLTGCGGGNSTAPLPNTTVMVSPKRVAVVATTQSQQFTASVTGVSNTSVTWSVDGTSSGTLSAGTITTSGLYTPPATPGTHTITATSVAFPAASATASVAVTDLAGVFTYHNNLARDGTNLQEYALTSSSVGSGTFGKLFSCAVDGAVYTQPLWVPSLSIGGGTHNVFFVATQHDSLYAFDADATPCVKYWQINMIDALHGGTAGESTVPCQAGVGCDVGAGYGDIQPEIGVTGTPVIDPATNTIYLVSKSEITATTTTFHQRLHAIDLGTGNEKFNGPVEITASVPGVGDGSSGGILSFNTQNEHQRSGLALANGTVYVAWAAHEDQSPYHGWLMSYNASNLLVQQGVFNTTPNGGLGGIWSGGGAPAIDSDGSIYVATGNGIFDANVVTTPNNDYGDSLLKLNASSGLTLADWFTPDDQQTLSDNDTDLGSGAIVLLPDQSGPVAHLLAEVGKEGVVYLVDRDNMGHFQPANNSQIVQSFSGAGLWGTPAFWQNSLYFGGAWNRLMHFTFDPTSGQFNPALTSQSAQTFNFPGASPSVSSQGANNGIVWAIDSSAYGNPAPTFGPAILHAYSATNLATEYWNSTQAASNRDQAGNAVKFVPPTIANGKVYVGTRTEIDVYGLLPN